MKAVLLMVLGISVSFGTTPAKAPARARSAKAQPVEVSDTQVEKWTKEWQARLSLSDWNVSTLIVHTGDLKPETLGNLRWNSADKTAVIRVLSPSDYDLPAAEIPVDIEYTILHELIHLQLSVLPRDAAAKGTEERVVNRISEALFALEKGPSYKPRSSVAHLQVKDKPASDGSQASRASSAP